MTGAYKESEWGYVMKYGIFKIYTLYVALFCVLVKLVISMVGNMGEFLDLWAILLVIRQWGLVQKALKLIVTELHLHFLGGVLALK